MEQDEGKIEAAHILDKEATPPPPRSKRNRLKLVAGLAVLTALVAVVFYYLVLHRAL